MIGLACNVFSSGKHSSMIASASPRFSCDDLLSSDPEKSLSFPGSQATTASHDARASRASLKSAVSGAFP